ncbi:MULTISPECIES: DNA polymerase III subunit epsilon [Thalassospira]|jgi:DNA polymerase-3 subunit epsilon|uniref:DNA polymerase III subunit epsilon n=1 Tax=Thalassospira xiamenensis TaxID=220697 RepID=A0ABR5XYZ6_9PROT|nr:MULTISPECIES: DNA polymerase III subunit epsilon [Thalassospira]KZD01735.1 DNA polymerase III subunit epsilon [Thalassospira xiamenensis]KZD11218.1 DNA polymerase III subunit epsilon [Thalassospira xiamenensis]MAB32620.1 DNA polymerase III subunit epsilon [Thalassospira sp.]MBA06450.1 DNA polymerase III subunit epsilon [Thalassospira sp.]MBL4840353.1 DNA polymerase III subunit epsilon [Thalassospira sp.]|tara:strand:+ start:101 stop:814 length:714 start_codon:yes stop_codon:yes gene_type:complete
MREIVLDTETTGLDPYADHRLVEIGCIELINHMPTGQQYHQYINPQRPMPREAFDVHGLGDDFLKDQPVFAEIVDDFLKFIGDDSLLVIHNAAFDMKFLNAELEWLSKPKIAMNRAIDTVQMARKKFPGSPVSLDALCRRFKIDNSNRTLHGALLDSDLLALVYLELLGGRQHGLLLDSNAKDKAKETANTPRMVVGPKENRLEPRLHIVSDEELAAHRAYIETKLSGAFWLKHEEV